MGEIADVAQLVAYYRANGESEHVLAIEQVLGEEFLTTAGVAALSGRSAKFCRKALEYLALEGRVERSIVRLDGRVYGVSWRYVWRKVSL